MGSWYTQANFIRGNPTGKEHLACMSINGRILLNFILKRMGLWECEILAWVHVTHGRNRFWTLNDKCRFETFDFINCGIFLELLKCSPLFSLLQDNKILNRTGQVSKVVVFYSCIGKNLLSYRSCCLLIWGLCDFCRCLHFNFPSSSSVVPFGETTRCTSGS